MWSAVCKAMVALIAGVVVVGLGLAARTALAAPAWLAPVNLAEEAQEVEFGPYVAMDGQGDAVALWQGGSRNETSRMVGGDWQEPGSLAGEGGSVGQSCVAAGSGGETVAVWERWAGKSLVVESALRSAVGGWQAPVELNEQTGVLALRGCRVAVDPAGDAVVVWAVETIFEFNEVWAAYKPAGGGWEAAIELRMPENPASAPDVAIDAHGDAMAVWVGRSFTIQGEYKPAGSDWRELRSGAEAETLSASGHTASEPGVAFDSDGNAVAIWDAPVGGGEEAIQATSRAAGGAWQAPADIAQVAQEAHSLQLAVDSHGDALAVWDLFSGEQRIAQSADRPDGGAWQQVVDLSEAGEDAYYPELAMDGRGDAVVVWEAQNGKDWSVQSATRAAGASWQTPVNVSPPTEHEELFPQVAIDSYGDALAAWELRDGTSYLVQAAGYQASGPQLDGLTAPSTAVVGEQVAFAVSPLSVWAALSPTKWSFGDGGSATGTSVAHTYAAAGAYQVTVTGEDVLGNTSTASSTITVSPTPTKAQGQSGAQSSTGTSTAEGSPTEGPGKSTMSGSSRPPGTPVAFTIVGMRVTRTGAIVLTLKPSVPGTFSVSARVKPAAGHSRERKRAKLYGTGSARARAAGVVSLTIFPRRDARAATRRRAVALVRITFTPLSGASQTETRAVMLGRKTRPTGAHERSRGACSAATTSSSSSIVSGAWMMSFFSLTPHQCPVWIDRRYRAG